MLAAAKLALRITTAALDADIQGLIDACKADLCVAGVGVVEDTDALTRRAIILYVKADFNADENGERYMKAYEHLKAAMCLSSDYAVGDDS